MNSLPAGIPIRIEAPLGWDRVAAAIRSFPDRLTERHFWIIQAAMIGITVLHMALEATKFWERSVGVGEVLPHAPLILLVVPITLAGYWYGLEGGLLTGIWSAILASPNLVLWHADAYQWVGELSYLLVISTIGVLVAIPVERERLECRRAESASHRLRLLNEISAILARSIDIENTLQQVSSRLRNETDLNVRIVLGDVLPSDLEEHTPHQRFPVEAEGKVIGALVAESPNGHPLSSEESDLLRAVGVDVGVAATAERLHREERDNLRLYVGQVTHAQEAERRRVSRDLHDGVAQSLVSLCRRLDDLAKNSGARSRVIRDIDRLRPLAEGALVELRRISRNLRPSILDDLGLRPALEALASEFCRRTEIRGTVECFGIERRLTPEIEVTLYRIAQEALWNIDKHARATRTVVELRYDPDRIGLTVTDDGIGFDDSIRSDSRLGLTGMSERAQLLGGTFSITSTMGEGTILTVVCPA